MAEPRKIKPKKPDRRRRISKLGMDAIKRLDAKIEECRIIPDTVDHAEIHELNGSELEKRARDVIEAHSFPPSLSAQVLKTAVSNLLERGAHLTVANVVLEAADHMKAEEINRVFLDGKPQGEAANIRGYSRKRLVRAFEAGGLSMIEQWDKEALVQDSIRNSMDRIGATHTMTAREEYLSPEFAENFKSRIRNTKFINNILRPFRSLGKENGKKPEK